jgi:hypothetical protein
VLSLVALALWLIVKQPFLSVILITAAQFIGFVPSLRKAYYRPHDESVATWLINALRYVMMVFTLASYTLTSAFSYAFWIVGYGGAALFLLWRRFVVKRKNL